ncbi:hypothetical protein TrVFT333_010636 [Trichoderma virens FT-333]|nr:hypothetical protein TrVFT333_010636 [Trichoderma virens FT-333]
MSECLTSWKASGRESGMVDLAISSLALAIFSRTQKHRPAAREAFKAYGRLLSVAKEDITQAKILTRWPEGIDECLLTVVLMGWYETTMHKLEYFGPKDAIAPMHSWSHYDGAMAILRAWNMSYTAPSSVVKQARRGIIRLALLRSYQLPDWILDGHRFGERSIDLSFDKLLVQAANLRHALKCHKVKKSLHAPMSEHLEHQARELDEASQDWAGQIPSAWSYRPLDLAETSQWSRVDFYSSTIYCCTNPGYATVWINYFTIRMIILSTYLGLLKLDPPSEFIGSASGKERFACSIQLKEMADSLASTVPFCLGRFELGKSHDLDTSNEPTVILKTNERILPALALPAVWPMSVASGLDGVEPAQQLWFSTQLARLGQVLGDGALECAGTDQWRHEL